MKRLICKILGHKYTLFRKVTPTIRELKCKRCNEKFAMTDDCKYILPLDNELEAMHNHFLGI